MNEIIPTIFTQNKKSFTKRFRKISSTSKKIQIDIADGKFVSFKSIDINSIPSFSRSKLFLEAHLMVKNPEKYIESLRRKGFKKIIFHVETVDDDNFSMLTDRITALGMIPVVAVNPETRISNKLLDKIYLTKFVLLMGVRPGKENQTLKKSTFNKIIKIKSFSKKIVVQVDGGVNPKTAKLLFRAGADILNSGSFIFESKNPKKAMEELLGKY
jgi:ribulose-phosphate 3-epimerase